MAVEQVVSFRDRFLDAARNEREQGNITGLDFLRLRMASRRPEFEREVTNLIQEEAEYKGLALPKSGNGTIDWESFFTNFIAFLKELIPLILQLISLFLTGAIGCTNFDCLSTSFMEKENEVCYVGIYFDPVIIIYCLQFVK